MKTFSDPFRAPPRLPALAVLLCLAPLTVSTAGSNGATLTLYQRRDVLAGGEIIQDTP